MEVPAEIQKRVEEIYGKEVFFTFVQHKNRFVCKVRDAVDPSAIFDLFVVEDETRNFRPIREEDLHRISQSRIYDTDEKRERLKQAREKSDLDKRKVLEDRNKAKALKTEILMEAANQIAKNPAIGRAFEKEAKERFSVKQVKEDGKDKIVTERKKTAKKEKK